MLKVFEIVIVKKREYQMYMKSEQIKLIIKH